MRGDEAARSLDRALREAVFVVVDLETTGGRATDGPAIVEIGAVRVEGGRPTTAFQTLVDPRRPIRPFVTALTGIDDRLVAGAPPIEEALPRFLDFVGDAAALVAHNAPFDVGHLGAAHARLFGRPLAVPALCTIRLARRLLPEVRRRGLDQLAARLGVPVVARHRALPDAGITARIFCQLLDRALARGLETVAHLLDLQRRAPDGREPVGRIPRERLAALPRGPGVYHLLGDDGRVLYVGKAARLRSRLQGLLGSGRGAGAATSALVRQAHDLRVVETGSLLAAALLELRHRRELHPPFNRGQPRVPRVCFLRLAVRSSYPRLAVTWRLAPDRAAYIGPFASRRAAERAQAVLARTFGLRTCPGHLAPSPEVTPCVLGREERCTAPCAARIDHDGYRQRVEACLAFLDGRETPLSARGDALGDREVLEGLRRRYRELSCLVARNHFVVLLPGEERREAQLYVVLGGRLAFDTRVTAAADLLGALRFVSERLATRDDVPLAAGDVEASTVLAAWLRDRRREGLLLPFDTADDLAARFDELVVTLDDLRQRGPLPRIDGLS